MKEYSLNHMKLVLVDTKHNFFHWLVVVISRTIISSIFILLSFYFIALGFLFSAKTIEPFIPIAWTEKINFYSTQLPFFQLIKQSLLSQLGHWYQDAQVWLAMAVGIPLMALGMSVFLISLFNLFHSIVNPLYNRTHCPFCKEPIKVVKKG